MRTNSAFVCLGADYTKQAKAGPAYPEEWKMSFNEPSLTLGPSPPPPVVLV